MVKVMLPKGQTVQMDLDTWLALPWPRYFHVQKGGHVHVSCVLHRVATQAPKGQAVDHIDHNPLNNARDNLRLCSLQENRWNSRTPKSRNRKSKYKGVDKHPACSTFRARITVHGVTHYLGDFATEELAAEAYNEAARKHFGEYACPNKIEK